MTHSTRATAALQRLAEADPALAALSLWCRHRDAATGDAPAVTDGQTIWYAPGYAALPLHDQVGLAAHHVLHVAFRHAPRARGLFSRFGDRWDADIYALACDAIVNQMLVMAGYTQPRPHVVLVDLLDRALGERMTPAEAIGAYDAEKLYIRLMHGAPPGGDRGRGPRPDGNSPDAAGQARLYAAEAGFRPDLDTSGAGAAGDAEGPDEADWRQHLTRALEAGRIAGRGVGALGAAIADLPRPRTPWEVILRGLVTRAVTRAPRLDFGRPARRWLALDSAARAEGRPHPAVEPGLTRDRRVPRIALGVDASSSVDDAMLAHFLAQVSGISRRTGAEIHLLVFDETVRVQRVLDPHQPSIGSVEAPRGGGTSFVDVIARAGALTPSIIILLTDLDGPTGDAPRGIPVLWAVPDAARSQPPAFGTVLELAR